MEHEKKSTIEKLHTEWNASQIELKPVASDWINPEQVATGWNAYSIDADIDGDQLYYKVDLLLSIVGFP